MYGLNNGTNKHNDTKDIEMGDNTGIAEDNTKSGEDMEEEDELSSVAASDTHLTRHPCLTTIPINRFIGEFWSIFIYLLFFILNFVLTK